MPLLVRTGSLCLRSAGPRRMMSAEVQLTTFWVMVHAKVLPFRFSVKLPGSMRLCVTCAGLGSGAGPEAMPRTDKTMIPNDPATASSLPGDIGFTASGPCTGSRTRPGRSAR